MPILLDISTELLFVLPISSMRATCLSHLTFLDLITVIICGEKYRIFNTQIRNWEPNRKWSNIGIKYCRGIQMQSRGESRWRAWPGSFRIRGCWSWYCDIGLAVRWCHCLPALCGWTELEAQDTIDLGREYRKLYREWCVVGAPWLIGDSVTSRSWGHCRKCG